MSTVGDEFIQSIGKPDENIALGFQFSMEWDQIVLDDVYAEIGAGFFQNKFLYLFGEEVEALNACLAHWDFIFTDNIDRKVIGRNAHGSLLLIENESEMGTTASIGYLDLLNCTYSTNPDLDFLSLIGNWLPNDLLGNFREDSVYSTFLERTQLELNPNEILAIKVPHVLGGENTVNNFQIENIFEYHESIARVYKEAGFGL